MILFPDFLPFKLGKILENGQIYNFTKDLTIKNIVYLR